MEFLLLFCLASVGLTAILVDGVIFAQVRNWVAQEAQARRDQRPKTKKSSKSGSQSSVFEFIESILSCYQCCGFWSGLFCGIFLLTSFSEIGTESRSWAVLHTLMMWLCAGLAGSILSHVYLVCVELLFSLTMLAKRIAPDAHEHHHDHDHFDHDE